MESSRPLVMWDVFAGLGGASAAMRDRGWTVRTVDIDPQFQPDVVADVSTWTPEPAEVDLLWFSPPCTEFSKWDKPCWYTRSKPCDLKLVEASLAIVNVLRPRWWVIENVRGAIPWFAPLLGEPRYASNPVFLWGAFPPFRYRVKPWKEEFKRPADRAQLPYGLSLAIARACESVLF